MNYFSLKKFKFYKFVTRVIKMINFTTIINIDTPTWPLPTNTNVPKHTQNSYGMCYLHTILFQLFYLFISFCLKKKEKKSKTWPNYGSVIFCKASFIFNWKNFNTLWVIFFYLYINEVQLFISHSLVTKTGMSDNQKRGGCTSS